MKSKLSNTKFKDSIKNITNGLFLNLAVNCLKHVNVNQTNDWFFELTSPKTFFKPLMVFKKLNTKLIEKAEVLVDLVVTDHLICGNLKKKNRFLLNYLFRFSDLTQSWLSVNVSSLNAFCSVSSFWTSAAWLEREAWDLFGIRFTNNPDLRRIFTDYGFRGFPLRKDFPVFGFKEVRYNNERGSVTYDDVVFSQEEREIALVNPWLNQHYYKLPLASLTYFIPTRCF